MLCEWIASIGLNPSFFGTHSLRRTKATLIYPAGNLRAVQLLLGAPEDWEHGALHRHWARWRYRHSWTGRRL